VFVSSAKRTVDLGLGMVLAVLALPVMVVLAVAVGFSLRTWPLFTQQRVGRRGRLIRVIKIRTMSPGVPRYASRYEVGHIPTTRLCDVLRRAHLDELPQLLLVLTGRLSLVGPRPEMPFLAEEMDPGVATSRTQVRPGCTGLWQISPAASRLIIESPEYDQYYVDTRTVRLDMWVLWRTVLLMSRIGGPVGLADIPRWALSRRAAPGARRRPEGLPVTILEPDRV
jgi:lipopolysaccharide/colanic/teichoic acid biosynthesis glycosyltransferase